MTKRLVEVDDDLLLAAQSASGESTIKATVHAALELLVTQHRHREAELRQRWAELGDRLGSTRRRFACTCLLSPTCSFPASLPVW